jgi:hypothetical protein
VQGAVGRDETGLWLSHSTKELLRNCGRLSETLFPNIQVCRRLLFQLWSAGTSHYQPARPCPHNPLAQPPLISGVRIASRMGGEGASLESEDWSPQAPLTITESSLPLAPSSSLRCLVSPFIVSCERGPDGSGRKRGK